MRFDSDFFRPDYLRIQNQMTGLASSNLRDYGVAIRHPKEIARRYVDDGVAFLRAQNVRPMSIDLDSNAVFISEVDAYRLQGNALAHQDILLTRTGANYGQCAIYLEDTHAIASSHTFIIKSGNLNPFLLTVFLNSYYGRMLIDKGVYGGAQPEIAPDFLYQIPMPTWDVLPQAVESIYLRSYDLLESSKAKYSDAADMLMAELNLVD